MDYFDRKIIEQLQENADVSLEEISSQVGLSKTPCWNRIEKLKKKGIINGKVSLVDREKLGYNMLFFVFIKTDKHERNWVEKFQHLVAEIDIVLGFYRLAGEYDYVLKVVAKNVAEYDAFYKKIIDEISIYSISSYTVLEEIKNTTKIPVPPQ